MSYTSVPTTGPLQPSYQSYKFINLTANIELSWLISYNNTPYVVAGWMTVNSSSNANVITLPDATLVSVGASFVFTNIGSNSFIVNKNDGTSLKTITTTQQFIFLLTDNTTQGGSWLVTQLASVTSAADASALQGLGLTVLGYDNTKLNTNMNISNQGGDYTILYTDRATMINATGGNATFTLPLSTSSNIGNGFYFAINNSGSGTITVTPTSTDKINGVNSFTMSPETDSMFLCDGNGNYYSLGYNAIQLSTATWPNGSNTIPSIRGTFDPTTGMYWQNPSSHVLGFACNGINNLNLTPTSINPLVQIQSFLGSINAPGYSFAGYPGDGIFFDGTSINFASHATPGVPTAQISNNGSYIFYGEGGSFEYRIPRDEPAQTRAGFITLVAGSSGDILNNTLTANTRVFMSSYNSTGSNVGALSYKFDNPLSPTKFIITSTNNADTSVVEWFLIEMVVT